VEDQVIDSQMVQKILKDLKDRPELSKLTFENNDIKDFDGMCTVFSQLKQYDKLEGINFRLNNFNEKLIEALAEGIKMKKELRTIDLGENRITDSSIKVIGEALRTHVRLHMLFLDNNKITDAGAEGLAECLKNKQDLRIFNIDNN